MDDKIKLLLIEDSPTQAMAIQETLRKTYTEDIDFDVEWVDTLSKGLEHLSAKDKDTDIILCDLGLPDSCGLETFAKTYSQAPTIPIVVLTGITSNLLAIKCLLQKGAQDYLIKGQGDGDSIVRSIRYSIERKKAEVKLKEAITVKSQFLSVVSHELRTPLTAIKEAIRLVHSESTGELNDEQKEFLDIARRNVDRLARLINNVLDFQKLEAGAMTLDIQENDINVIAKEVKEALTPLAKEKGLTIVTRLDEMVPMVKFDRDSITQVLTNLVNNSIKFTAKGQVTITTSKGQNIVQVSVSDTGCGIIAEDLPKVFNEFEQLSNSNERQTGGTGLGLAISKEIIEQHRGKICLESEPGKGTTFYFVLPIKERRSKIRSPHGKKNLNC